MYRPCSDKVKSEIKKFKSAGFARSSPVLLNYMRVSDDRFIRIFRPRGLARPGKGSIKYTTADIFGSRYFSFVYDIRFKKKFIDYLVNVFLKNNPEPEINIRKAFTHLMHNNGLHWEQCSCVDKEDYQDGNQEDLSDDSVHMQ